MGGFDRRYQEMMLPAVEAARAVLRDLEPKEVPKKLRQVATYSGGTLPPPHAAAVLEELDRNQWLRGKVAEQVATDGEPFDAVSLAFIERDSGWWQTIADTLAARSTGDAEERAEEAERAADSLQSQLGEAKSRQRLVEARASEAEAELKARLSADAGPLKRALEESKLRIGDLEGELLAVAEDRDQAVEAHIEAEKSARQLYERVRELRRERAALLRAAGEGGRESLPRDPVGLARFLDSLSAALAPHREPPTVAGGLDSSGIATTLDFPPQLIPDSAAAIDWLLELPTPAQVLVDGYNVLGLLAPRDMFTGAARRDLHGRLGRLTRAAPQHAVVVVYDSSLAGERESFRPTPGLEVRFSPSGISADEELVAMASSPTPAVVISDDREVREGAAAAGAQALWSTALLRWLKRPN